MQTAVPYRSPWLLRVPRLRIGSGLFFVSMLSAFAMLGAWFAVTATGFANELFLPSPIKVLHALVDAHINGYQGVTLSEHLLTSLGRVLSGFGLACAAGIPLGILMGLSRGAEAALSPVIEFYRPLPPRHLYAARHVARYRGEIEACPSVYGRASRHHH